MMGKGYFIRGDVREAFSGDVVRKFSWDTWVDHPENPLIEPPFDTKVIAEPTIIMPDSSPDGRWHLYAVSLDAYINHMDSADGVRWNLLDRFTPGWNPFVVKEGDTFYMFHHGHWFVKGESAIVCRSSKNLKSWTEDRVVLRPTFDWEKEGGKAVVRNACVVKLPDKTYRLYYASGYGWLDDCGYEEPLYNGVAFATNITGPYRKHDEPVIGPNGDDPYRNIGAGGLKVYYEQSEQVFVGFNNGIYRDREGRSRSAIHMLLSTDGLGWYSFPHNPVLRPEKGWKEALVYQLDIRRVGNEIWLWYNSRDGWKEGVERIGLAKHKLADGSGVFPQFEH
jgi:hypothetical protein